MLGLLLCLTAFSSYSFSQIIIKLPKSSLTKLSKISSELKNPFNEKWMNFQTITDSYFIVNPKTKETIENLLGSNTIQYYQSQTYALDDIPNDPMFKDQWNLRQIEWNQSDVLKHSPTTVKVAIIDTGIDWLHQELKNQFWINSGEAKSGSVPDTTWLDFIDNDNNGLTDDIFGYNFLENKVTTQPIDDQGHGTSVSGIIAAQSNNGIGISGIAPNVKIMSLKAFDETGNGNEIDIAKALLYAWYQKVDVVNMSFGINSVRSLLLEDICQAMEKEGILLVASSGNNSSADRHYPSSFESVISVGASNQYSDYASFSNYGNSVDLLAPGVNIPTTKMGNVFTAFSGTSAAAPHVSAVLAVLKGIDQSLTTEKARALLQETATKIRGVSFSSRTLSGILNLKNILQKYNNNYAVRIVSPLVDSWWLSESLHVAIQAISPNFKSWSLSWQKGITGNEQWTEFASDTKTRLGEVSGLLRWSEIKNTLNNSDSAISLRLSVENMNGTKIEDRRSVFRYRNSLTTDYFQVESSIEAEDHFVWINSKTNHPVKVTLNLTNGISQWTENSQTWKYLNFIKLKIPTAGSFIVNVQLEDLSGEKLTYQKNIILPIQPSISQYNQINLTTLKGGSLLAQNIDFNQDGLTDFVISRQTSDNNYGNIYFYSGADLTAPKDSIMKVLVPVNVVKYNQKWYFLAVSLGKSYLYSSNDSLSFPTQLIWSSEPNKPYWAALLFVENQNLNIIYRDNKNYYLSSFNNNSNQFSLTNTFEYPLNELQGPARVKLVRYNNANNKQLFFADQNGNIFLYDFIQNNSSTLTFANTLPLYNASDFVEASDITGDGRDELLVLSSDLDETDYRYNENYPTRWNFRVYSFINGTDSVLFEKWFTGFKGLYGLKNHIKYKRINNEHYVLLGLNPNEYVLKWNNLTNQFEMNSVFQNLSSWGVMDSVRTIAGDYQFVFDGGKYISGWNKNQLDEDEPEWVRYIQLSDSTGYFKVNKLFSNLSLYKRDFNPNTGFSFIKSVSNTDSIFFSVKPNNQILNYLITSRNYPHFHQNRNNQIAVRNYERGAYSTSIENKLLIIKSSNPILFDEKLRSEFTLNGQNPNTLQIDESKKNIVVRFDDNVIGWFKIPPLQDENHRMMISLTDSIFISQDISSTTPFYITHYDVLSEHDVKVFFNSQIDVNSLSNLIIKISPDYPLKYSVVSDNNSLTISNTNRPWGSISSPILLELSGLKSLDNRLLHSPGNQVEIEMLGTSIENVVTYPSPFVIGNGNAMTFGNLTNKVTIRIYDFSMRLKRTLLKESQSGIFEFDGKTESGEWLSSGIYFYMIEDASGNKKINKFVVIR